MMPETKTEDALNGKGQKLRDIKDRADIELMVRTFYDHIRSDELLGPIFDEIANVNWEKHFPTMFDFWEQMLFHTGAYRGNAMKVHADLNEKYPLSDKEFKQWIKLFDYSIDSLFEGPITNQAKVKALSVATAIRIKLAQ